MLDAMGVIYDVGNDTELKELTRKRSVAALPVGGRYRLIDFLLSNMVNSGISNIGIITQNHYDSLMTHLGSGKEWDLNRKRDGLFIFPPYSGHDHEGWFKGNVDAFHSIMGYIRRSHQKYLIVSENNILCNMTYNNALKCHIEKGADITIIYKDEKEIDPGETRRFTLLETSENGRVTGMEFNPARTELNSIYMKMFIIDKNMFERLIEEGVARGNVNFLKDMVLDRLDSLNVYGYRFDGYADIIDSVNSYYKSSMDLLKSEVRQQVFLKSGLIYTRIMDEVPARYSGEAIVKNSLVADGCVIEGEVENCVLFRGVKVGRGAKLRNSIVMQNSQIMENAILENVITDKEVIVSKNKRLTGQDNYPVVVRKRALI